MNEIVSGFVTGGVLAIRGGLSVAFKNALIGGLILTLIQGVTVGVSAIMMRQQYKMMEEMQKQEMERIRMMQERGRAAADANPWAVDYDADKAKKASSKESETMIDKAKAFSF